MRKYLVAAILAAAVAVLASAAFGSTKSPARQSSAGSAIGDVRQDAHDRPRGAVHRPRRRHRKPAGSLGEVLRQALERAEGEQEQADQGRRRRHPARCRHGVRGQGREVVRLELEAARRRRPGRQPGGRRVHVGLQGRRPRVRLGLRESHVAHGRPHRRQPARVLLPHRAERRRARPDGRQLDDQEAEVEAGLHHRRPGDLLAGPGRRRAARSSRRGASRSPATRSARPTRTSRPRSRRSRATPRASTSRGSSPRRLRPSGSS